VVTAVRRIIVILASVVIAISVYRYCSRENSSNCDTMSLDVFSQFGCAELIDNKAQAAMRHRTISCHNECLPGVKKAIEIQSVLETPGFGVLVFKKRDAFESLDASSLLTRLRIVQGSTKFEVAVMDRNSRIAFLHCEAPSVGRTYNYLLRFRIEELEKATCRMVPQDAFQFSIGFSAGSYSGPGHHVMEVLGIQVLDGGHSAQTVDQVTCHLAPCNSEAKPSAGP
jgi:hypothetical protein